ncbi:uncharacterized protein LOC126782973 [Argentina anserina]|uniref:uncharacterized protein LOC126782973 n=1 Tax=Argentina anserina TaxID=57926 RepID=UPI0021764ADE|nr:uncharacterized protein LOC126782973 [Potentilla anserina]XP_050364298.1 uncharacterized protein LOC126782973 [Potentilla anserina]XP_050364299.1 uncharacterized protein LOC126782973 [Potentilla anserina]
MMTDCVVRSYQESEGTNDQASYPGESVYMAHWMCTSCKSETKTCGHHEEASKHDDDIQKHPLFRRFGEVAASERVRKTNEGVTLIESSKKLSRERLECQSFPMFNVAPETSLAKRNQQALTGNRRLLSESNSSAMQGWAPTDVWPLEASPPQKEPQVKCHKFLEDSNSSVPKPFQDGPMRLNSKLGVHQFKCGSTSMPFFNFRGKEVNQYSSLLAHQHVASTYKYTSSTFLIHEKNINSKLVSRRSGCSLSRQNDVIFIQHNPSTSCKHVQEERSKSGEGLFLSQSASSEVPRHEKAYRDFCLAPSLQHAVYNTETMRICAVVDAEKESSRDVPNTIPFPKRTAGCLSEGSHMFRDTNLATKLKGKAVRELLGSPEHAIPMQTGQAIPMQTGFKLLPYMSAKESEEEGLRDVKRHTNNLDDESSSENDTLDMDAFQFQDNLLGVVSSPLNEHTEGGQKSPTSQPAFTAAREDVRGRPSFTILPDMNQELPELAAYASLADERETSTSSTQSLDVEHLLAHAGQPTNSKSSGSPDGPQELDPSIRWVKRLKLSDAHFACGTKNTKMGEASSHGKVEKVAALYKKNMKCSLTNSQSAVVRFHGREQMALDETPMLLRNGESSSSDSARTSQNISLSHPWIRRWSHKVLAPNMNSEAAVVSQPQSSKATFNQFQRKKFPSIAAMALMGKAMNGFNPCEFAKKGSFVVWNTKEF